LTHRKEGEPRLGKHDVQWLLNGVKFGIWSRASVM